MGKKLAPTSVGEIMTEKLETINILNTAQEAAAKMTKKNVSSLAVVDDEGRALGMVTERDLARKVCAKGERSDTTVVQEILSTPVITINPDYSLEEAAELMMRRKVRHLLVVDDSDKPVGIITPTDFAAYLKENVDLKQLRKTILQVLREHRRYE